MQFSKKWLKSVTTLNPYYSQLLSPWPWTALAIGRELRSIAALGSAMAAHRGYPSDLSQTWG